MTPQNAEDFEAQRMCHGFQGAGGKMNVVFVGNQHIFNFFCGGAHVVMPHGSLCAHAPARETVVSAGTADAREKTLYNISNFEKTDINDIWAL
jgi:hypothetical protein